MMDVRAARHTPADVPVQLPARCSFRVTVRKSFRVAVRRLRPGAALRVVPGCWAGYGRNCCFVTVVAEVAAEPGGLRLAVFKVSYVAGDGAERQVPLAEATGVPFEQ